MSWSQNEWRGGLVSMVANQPTPVLIPWRCSKCNTILAKMHLQAGSVVEIKCAKCNTMATREAA